MSGRIRGICFNCGRVVYVRETTSGSYSSDRSVPASVCGCGLGEIKQRSKKSEQLEKYRK